MSEKEPSALDKLRHTSAHLLAAAVMDLWPATKRTIGPAIENGFYYDFDFGETAISDQDLPTIESKMAELLPSWDKFRHEEVSKDEALKRVGDNQYKKELIEEFATDGQKLTFYKIGDLSAGSGQVFEDLCRGGHAEHPNKDIGAFKLLSLAGAYWRGSEKNKMLTRIYGTAFPTKKELEDYLKMLEEAKKRDHKKLGPQLDLFMFHETSPGMPYWLPKGVVLYNELVDFWRKEHKARGYQEIVSPLFNKKELYETSGHWQHYKDDMFVVETSEGETYAAKPMNCPNAMVVFGSKLHSYRDLPLRLSDTDTLHRNELSGTLNGLLRVREFRQDDAHIFVTEDQIKEEYEQVFDIVERFYSIFALPYSFRLGTRPEGFMGDKETWEKAESTLKEILKDSGKDFVIAEGDGAFYGPKIDILMKDSLGRSWQMGTIQLDFQQPRNFKLVYTGADGKEKTPAVIHRVVYGSLERFIGIIIEHFAGALPTWLAPVQAVIVPIAERHTDYATKVANDLRFVDIRVEVDDRNETMQNKIRLQAQQKIPYILVIGDKEQAAGSVAVRTRDGENRGVVSVSDFVDKVTKEISQKSLVSLFGTSRPVPYGVIPSGTPQS